ncbi:MAG: DUF6152 family protein [Rhodospirillaceae bacterium]|nr:DUF6152 family protein [Rhodospirillaceae bacterium]
MRKDLVTGLAVLGQLLAAAPVAAHHAFAAEFDANQPVRLEGTVARMEWISPHSWLHLDVTTPDGTVERWMIEGGPPNALFRRGITQESLPVGTQVIVEGFRARDGSMRANGRDITFADGSRPFVGSFSTGPAP